jgi:hypothetical protein
MMRNSFENGVKRNMVEQRFEPPQEDEDQQEHAPTQPLPMMSCWQFTLALRAAGFGWDELS